MEREVGGGIGMGNTCKPMAVSFQCMTKFTTNKKKIKIKIKLKKIKKNNKVDMNMDLFRILFSFLLDIYPEMGIFLNHMGVLNFI